MKNYRLLDACENCKHYEFIAHPQGWGKIMYCIHPEYRPDVTKPSTRVVQPNGKCDNWEGE